MNKTTSGERKLLSSSLEYNRLRRRYYDIRSNGGVFSEEWDTIAKFVKWANAEEFRYFDFLIPNFWQMGCKVYGPDSAAFVPQEVAAWLTPAPATEELLLGVRYQYKSPRGNHRYVTSSRIGRDEPVKELFNTQIEAHHKFLEFRLEVVEHLAAKIKDPRKRAAFLLRAVAIADALAEGRILTEL